MSCAYCITKQYHMLVIQQSDGNYHVHAPFDDKKAMKTMLDQIKKAQKNWGKDGR